MITIWLGSNIDQGDCGFEDYARIDDDIQEHLAWKVFINFDVLIEATTPVQQTLARRKKKNGINVEQRGSYYRSSQKDHSKGKG